MNFFDGLMEVVYWIQIFISPVLVSAIIAAIVYFNNTNNYLSAIGILVLGVILGVFFAERVRRKSGTATFMGREKGNSEFMKDDVNEKK
jgi:hypothetical protein